MSMGSICVYLFPVHRSGEPEGVEWVHYFYIFEISFFSQHFPHHFYSEKKNIYKKKILQPLDCPQLWPSAGQETNHFLRVASEYLKNLESQRLSTRGGISF